MARKTTTRPTISKRTSRSSAPAASVSAAGKAPKSYSPSGESAASKVFGKRELTDLVVKASGIKKRAAKPVIEAMLKELGDAFSRGDTVNLQPFGKGIVKSYKNLDNAEVMELRLRRSKQAMRAANNPVRDPLAEAAE